MTDAPFQPRRSLIFAPGDKPEMLAKAAASGADMACLDLEDAVAPQHKALAGYLARRYRVLRGARPQ